MDKTENKQNCREFNVVNLDARREYSRRERSEIWLEFLQRSLAALPKMKPDEVPHLLSALEKTRIMLGVKKRGSYEKK